MAPSLPAFRRLLCGKTAVFPAKSTRFMNFAILWKPSRTPGLSISRILTREGAAVPGGRACRDQTPAPRWVRSVVIGWRLILTSGLLVVAALAQRTPVAAVPEQLLITTVRDHMIHDRCLHVFALLHTLLTQRVRLQELFTGLTPCSVIATTDSGPHFFWVQRLVDFTVFGPGRYQRRAAGMLARDLRFRRHQCTRPHSANFSKPPRPLMYCLAVSTISL